MAELKFATLKIMQGAPVVNDAIVCKESGDIVAIEIDLRSKYCEISGMCGGDSGPGILIEATDGSLYLADGVDRDISTEITFADYGPEWYVWAASCGRYTAYVCLVRKEDAVIKGVKQ